MLTECIEQYWYIGSGSLQFCVELPTPVTADELQLEHIPEPGNKKRSTQAKVGQVDIGGGITRVDIRL